MPALANIYCHGVPSGLTLTGEMYPDGSDTAAVGGTGLTVTEQTNRKGSYVVNAGVAGLHLILLKSGSDVVAQKWSPSNLAITGDFEAFNTREAALIYADTNELQIDWADGGRLDLLIDAIKVITDAITATGTGLSAIPWNASWDAEVQSEVDDALKAALTEGYRSTGATGSVRDLLYEIIAHLGESSISSTTKTLKKIDGSTTAKTYTLDSATTPTSITEAT